MVAGTSTVSPSICGIALPKMWKELVLSAFLVTQCLDGLYTYIGVITFGIGVEGNPIIAGLMTHLGHGIGLISAKVTASVLGICLYLREIHTVVAALTGFYLTAAIGPWTLILFF